MTKPFAEVIGDPIAQSKSPTIHSFWLEKLGLDADYGRALVHPEELAFYLSRRRADAHWRGCNVTMPHKQAIIPLLDRLDPIATRVLAVNTVIREADGALLGTNTDVAGFLEPLYPSLDDEFPPQNALVIGAGGAARAIVAALADGDVKITLAARNTDQARALLDELAPQNPHKTVELSQLRRQGYGTFDLVVNASPLGMVGNPPLEFHLGQASEAAIIYDIVTAPLETPLIAAAKAQGLRTIDGLAMLIGQAAVAFEAFYDAEPPRADGDAELRAHLLA